MVLPAASHPKRLSPLRAGSAAEEGAVVSTGDTFKALRILACADLLGMNLCKLTWVRSGPLTCHAVLGVFMLWAICATLAAVLCRLAICHFGHPSGPQQHVMEGKDSPLRCA
jgi:hypothetical protein